MPCHALWMACIRNGPLCLPGQLSYGKVSMVFVRSSGSARTRRIDKGRPGNRSIASEASWIRCRRAKVATLAQRPESLDSLDRAATRAAKSAWLRQPGLQSTAAKLLDKQRCSEARALERGHLLTKEITPDIRPKAEQLRASDAKNGKRHAVVAASCDLLLASPTLNLAGPVFLSHDLQHAETRARLFA